MTVGLAGDARYEEAARQESACWPGVSVEFKRMRKHAVCIVTFNGESRKLVYPSSGSDARGPLNHRQDMRAALRDLGAERTPRRKAAQAPKQKPKRRAKSAVVVRAQRPDVPTEDRWEARLRVIAKDLADRPATVTVLGPPPRVGFWRRVAHRIFAWGRAA